MPFRPTPLPGPLTLIPSDKLRAQAAALSRDHPHLGLPVDPGRLVAMLNARPDGVAVTFNEPKGSRGDWSLLLYLPACTVRLYLTKKYSDAYMIGSINLIRPQDHHRLARGCLLVRPAGWRLAFDVHSIPRPSDSYWSPLVAEWKRLTEEEAARRGAPVLTAAQSAFLDTLDQVIDADERISTLAAEAAPFFPYGDVTSTGERRHGTRSVYVFKIVGENRPEEGAFVRIRGELRLRGQVTRVIRDAVTVRFDQPVAWERFDQARQGELEITASRVVYDKQREAVGLLRSRQSHNLTFLRALVDGTVSPIPATPIQPRANLDVEQFAAFQKGVATEDVVAVLGPPGTGKTLVISELVRAAAVERGERILVTSKTNRAVDNVLARLPEHLEAIRVGHDGSVTGEGQPYLLERRAAELRERVLGDPAHAAAAYDGLDAARGWIGELDACVAELNAAAAAEAQAAAYLDAIRRTAGGAFQVQVDRLVSERDAHQSALDRCLRRSEQRARRLDWARARQEWPVIGAAFGMLAMLWMRRQTTANGRAEHLRDVWRYVNAALEQAECELEAATRADPSVRTARKSHTATSQRRETCRADALRAARESSTAVATMDRIPHFPLRSDNDILHLLQWLKQRLPLLEKRAELLARWHTDIGGAPEQLYPELLRYADVIAATCIGSASRPEMAGIRFDLAIVDEAGQIGVADALVPLVRARRSVLVGDDRQLPPFLDSEVESWGASVGDPLVRDLLAKSALERLVGRLPVDHVIPLVRQRRMPESIAEFVSGAFYRGELRTEVHREHRDELFARPLAFIDTTRLPEEQRRETAGRGRERWGKSGYVNHAEARLLVEMAVHYHRRGVEWAVITPYRAQLAKIKTALTRRIGNAELVESNVGTVDSFQGGEREVILYGFTRSNRDGRIGFLKELRRANVAFTRVQSQLVLVGDLSTLTRAADAPFRDMAISLVGHVGRDGDLRQYQEIYDRVRRLNEGGR